MSGGAPRLHEVLARCALELGPIPKGDRMTEGPAKYNYRGIESILKKAAPLLATAGVVVTPEVVDREVEHVERGRQGNIWRLVTLTVRYTLTGPAGDQLVVTTCAEGLDPGDKASNKALTAALKQMLTQVLLISDAQEDPDHEPSQETRPVAAEPPGPFDRVAERISRLDDDTRAAVREWCHANDILVTRAALSDEQADQVLAWLDRREAPFEDDK